MCKNNLLTHHSVRPICRIIASLVVGLVLVAACAPADKGTGQVTIGLITNNPNGLRNVQGFRDAMTKLGYLESENVTYVFEGAPVAKDDLDAALSDMVSAKVDLIFTAGTPTGVAAHRVTAGSDIPVVFGVIADPIAAGVLTDLTRPGGNMTGVMLSQSQTRRLELLLEIVPGVERVYVPYNPDDAAPASALAQIQQDADRLDVLVIAAEARSKDQVNQLLDDLPQDIDAIFLVPDSVVNARLAEILAIAIDRKLPVSGPSTAQVEEGALTTYGFIHEKAGGQAAHIADRILKGADPGEIPIETAEFFLAINLQTAGAIGLEIPYEILQQAQVIIREDQ